MRVKSRRVRLAAVGGGLTAAVLVGVLGVREHALARFPGVDDPAHPSGMAPALDPDPRWTPVYVDDFTGTSPDGWYLYSGAPSSGPGGYWSPSHDIVQDGVLHLRTTYEDGRWVSGGLARTAPRRLASVRGACSSGRNSMRPGSKRTRWTLFLRCAWRIASRRSPSSATTAAKERSSVSARSAPTATTAGRARSIPARG